MCHTLNEVRRTFKSCVLYTLCGEYIANTVNGVTNPIEKLVSISTVCGLSDRLVSRVTTSIA